MEHYIDLNEQSYDWCVRFFDRIKRLLSVRIKLHHEDHQLANGDIFLFNHFSRAETFIPQYLIYHENGAFCRSVAAAQFFRNNNRMSRLLLDLGVIPNNHPELMLLLAADILRGRKIVIFPEGGMVKDRQVIDDQGRYSVYSRTAEIRRRHHTGAARLATGLQILKLAITKQHAQGQQELLTRWAESLNFPSAQLLVESANRPVSVVPANITFYPLRIDDNFLSRGADIVYRNLSPRVIEELVVEGNLFFKETDMDIRLGDPIVPINQWQWWERLSANYLGQRLTEPQQIFQAEYFKKNILRRTSAESLSASIARLRDQYMRDIYQEVTVNSSHITARIILQLVENGQSNVNQAQLCLMIYTVIKQIQNNEQVHLHRSLVNPGIYRTLLNNDSSELARFLNSARRAGLINIEAGNIAFLEKLTALHEFDKVRLENPIEVYANEIAPIEPVCTSIKSVVAGGWQFDEKTLARYRFDDDVIQFTWDKRIFSEPPHHEINSQQTATEHGGPFLLEHPEQTELAVILVHGFLASPAEVRATAEKIHARGFTVLGVRLRGHGTSPWDLRERSWQDWLSSVDEACLILKAFAKQVVLVGFSTGGALSLVSAASSEQQIAAVCGVCTPIKFRNKNMRFVPLMYGAGRIVQWVSRYEGLMPFRQTESEHKHINYRHMPIRGLYELTRLVAHVKGILGKIQCPVCLIQADEDHVVDPTSVTIVFNSLKISDKQVHWVPSKSHGILYDDIGNTQQTVVDFIDSVYLRLK